MKLLDVTYSSKLDPLARYIRRFLENTTDRETVCRTHRAIEDFCYGYPESFKPAFLNGIGITNKDFSPTPSSLDSSLENKFIDKLAEIDAEGVFLLKDAQGFLNMYRQKTGKG